MVSRIALVMIAAAVFFPAPSLALEKTAARFHDDSNRADWQRSFGTITIYYYNSCTGWVWVWSDWAAGDVVGVSVEDPCATNWNFLTSTRVFVDTGAPAGYGYTGVISVSESGGEGCPDVLLQEHPFLPTSGWNEHEWTVQWPTNQDLTVTVTFGPGEDNPATLVTDHPAAGATGPIACGTCYPSTRPNWSYYFGTATSPLCPGSPFHDGVCDAQLLFDVVAFCNDTHSPVIPTSWGSIKSLYR
jgi:hypothetical protein